MSNTIGSLHYVSRNRLERANRATLVAYLSAREIQCYKNETIPELRETALEIFEHEASRPDESARDDESGPWDCRY